MGGEVYCVRILPLRVKEIYQLKVNYCKKYTQPLKIKQTDKINKAIQDIKWNTKNSIQKKIERNNELVNKLQDGEFKPNHINNYFECKWSN